eukprot:g5132.t1
MSSKRSEKSSASAGEEKKVDTKLQEESFRVLLNQILDPSMSGDDDHTTSKFRAEMTGGTKDAEEEEHPMLLIQKKKEKLLRRRRACKLYLSSEFSFTLEQVNEEILQGKLRVRDDKVLSADIGLQKILVELLFQYNSRWLHIGLETIFGEIIDIKYSESKTTTDSTKKRQSWKPGRNKSGLTSEQLQLRKFLRERLLKDPELTSQFSKTIEGLYGNQNRYAKALHRHTLRTFLAIVLFLDKAAQLDPPLLPNERGLFRPKSKIKTSSAVVVEFGKEVLHGEGNVMKHLSGLGYDLNYKQTWMDEQVFRIGSVRTDLRDGIRLSRIAEILTETKSFELLSKAKFPAVSRLNKIRNVSIAIGRLKEGSSDFLRESKIKATDIVDGSQVKTLTLLWHIIGSYFLTSLVDVDQVSKEIKRVQRRIVSSGGSPASTGVVTSSAQNLLLQWAQSVCQLYNVNVTDWDTSFADGRAVCYLLHHYLPSLLPKEDICETSVDGDQTRHNFSLVMDRVKVVGFVPPVLTRWSSRGLPDEKIITAFLAYLCKILLESAVTIQAAITLQRKFRKWKKSKEERDEAERVGEKQRQVFAALKRATVLVQSLTRMNACRHKYLTKRMSAITLQRMTRGSSARREYLLMRRCATKLQATHRMILQRNEFNRMRSSAIVLQSIARMLYAQRDFDLRRENAVQIQSYVRMCSARRSFTRTVRGVVKLQSLARILQRKRYCRLKVAAVTLQSLVRMAFTRKRFTFLRAKRAAITIQRTVRMYRARRTFVQNMEIIRRMQRAVRSFFAKKRWAEMEQKATRIEAVTRGFIARKRYRAVLRATVCIQSTYQMTKQRRRYVRAIKACICIQRCAKAFVQRRFRAAVENARLVKLRDIRVRIAKRTLRNFYYIAKKKMAVLKILRATVLLQAVARGHITRVHTSKKIYEHRERIRQAAARATEALRLGNVTMAALADLTSYKQISQVKRAIDALETATRLSRECCARFANHGAKEGSSAVVIIYNLLTTLNRSEPHMNLRATAIKVLKNVARWKSLIAVVHAHENWDGILIDSMFATRCMLTQSMYQGFARAFTLMR